MATPIEKLFQRLGYVSKEKAIPPSVSAGDVADPFTIWRQSKKVPNDKVFEVYAGWVYACIRAIAEEIQSMQFEMYKKKEDGSHEPLENHEILDLLESVNPTQTGVEMRYLTAAHLEAAGNAYWYMQGVKNDTDKPTAFYILNPIRVKPIVNRNQFPTQIDRYDYRLTTHTFQFQPQEIIHFKYPDPSDPFEGIGTVQTIAQWIDADNYAMEFNRRFFLNGARVGGFLESDSSYTPEQLEYLKKSFENIYKGVENAYKVLALPKGTKYEEGGKTQKDIDFANLMLIMRDRILAGFRVPRTALGITDDVNRANAEATNYVFALRTIKPKMDLIVSYLNEFLVPRYGGDIVLSYKDPVPENREQRIVEMQAATGNAPVISINEAREEYFGLEGVEGGDDVAKPFSFLALGKVKPKEGKRLVNKRFPRPRKNNRAEAKKGMIEEIARLATEAAKAATEQIKDVKQKGITNLSDEEFEEKVYKGFALRVAPYEKLVAENIRSFNAKQKEEVQKNLAEAIKAVDPKKLFDLTNWITALVDLTTPAMTDLFEKEGLAAAELLGVTDIDLMTEDVRKALKHAMDLLGKKYNETTLDLLQSKLEEGQSAGLSLEDLQGKVGEVYEFSDDVRAEQVARTETFRIANAATHEAWKKTGVVKSLKWYTAADERVCPWCAPMHGKVVGIEENFFNKGDTVTGIDGSKLDLDYDDVQSPPLHVSCRCYTRPEEISIE